MQVLENFKHAGTFAQMSFGDKMTATLYVILLGMGITFVALVTIWGLTALMSKIIRAYEGSKEAAVAKVAPTAPAQATQQVVEDDTELVAVITAAVAASLNTSMHNIVVKNITRVGDQTPVWGQAGRSEVMNSRF